MTEPQESDGIISSFPVSDCFQRFHARQSLQTERTLVDLRGLLGSRFSKRGEGRRRVRCHVFDELKGKGSGVADDYCVAVVFCFVLCCVVALRSPRSGFLSLVEMTDDLNDHDHDEYRDEKKSQQYEASQRSIFSLGQASRSDSALGVEVSGFRPSRPRYGRSRWRISR